MKNQLSVLVLTVFLFSSKLAIAQTNSVAFKAGPEFVNVIKEYLPLNPPILNAIGQRYISELVVGVVADVSYAHQWKNGCQIETGFELRGFRKTFYYPVDSTPFYGTDFTRNPLRPYDRRIEVLQIGPFFNFGYRFKISDRFSLVPECGVLIYFNVIQKEFEHYYIADSMGIGDFGPYYKIEYYADNAFTDHFALIVGCSLSYHWTKRWSLLILPEAKFQTEGFDFLHGGIQTTWPLKLGVSYQLKRQHHHK